MHTLSWVMSSEPPADGGQQADLGLTTFPTPDGEGPLRVFTPKGCGPFPVLILLHGFPGTELNFDIAHAARRGGWVVLMPHYRGSWGAPGNYSWQHVLDDTVAVIAWARTREASAAFRLNSQNLVLVGHSLGGFAALWAAAHDGAIAAAASIAGFNFGAHTLDAWQHAATVHAAVSSTAAEWQSSTELLRGTSGHMLSAEAFAAGESWDLRAVASRAASRPLLLIAATHDRVARPEVHHAPLVARLMAARADRLETFEIATDHGFVDHRTVLTERVVGWLRERMRYQSREMNAR
jgi:uncharacterized protein